MMLLLKPKSLAEFCPRITRKNANEFHHFRSPHTNVRRKPNILKMRFFASIRVIRGLLSFQFELLTSMSLCSSCRRGSMNWSLKISELLSFS